jgi:hypothetical protein
MTIRKFREGVLAANCDGDDCGQMYADEESGDYLFMSPERLARLMRADGWSADPVLCPACQPAGLIAEQP